MCAAQANRKEKKRRREGSLFFFPVSSLTVVDASKIFLSLFAFFLNYVPLQMLREPTRSPCFNHRRTQKKLLCEAERKGIAAGQVRRATFRDKAICQAYRRLRVSFKRQCVEAGKKKTPVCLFFCPLATLHHCSFVLFFTSSPSSTHLSPLCNRKKRTNWIVGDAWHCYVAV